MSDNVQIPNIAEMSPDARPREKAMRHGIASLTDIELMAIIFGTGMHGRPVMEMCGDILRNIDGHLSVLAAMPASDVVKRFRGIGPAKALTLLAGLELGRRAARDAATMPEAKINGAYLAYNFMRDRLESLDHEEFWVLYLTPGARPISAEFIAKGGVAATFVDVKVIMRKALQHNASRMILFHNHPSGTLEPSAQDRKLTRTIIEAARIFDIRVDDHIIVSAKGFYSFSDNNCL